MRLLLIFVALLGVAYSAECPWKWCTGGGKRETESTAELSQDPPPTFPEDIEPPRIKRDPLCALEPDLPECQYAPWGRVKGKRAAAAERAESTAELSQDPPPTFPEDIEPPRAVAKRETATADCPWKWCKGDGKREAGSTNRETYEQKKDRLWWESRNDFPGKREAKELESPNKRDAENEEQVIKVPAPITSWKGKKREAEELENTHLRNEGLRMQEEWWRKNVWPVKAKRAVASGQIGYCDWFPYSDWCYRHGVERPTRQVEDYPPDCVDCIKRKRADRSMCEFFPSDPRCRGYKGVMGDRSKREEWNFCKLYPKAHMCQGKRAAKFDDGIDRSKREEQPCHPKLPECKGQNKREADSHTQRRLAKRDAAVNSLKKSPIDPVSINEDLIYDYLIYD